MPVTTLKTRHPSIVLENGHFVSLAHKLVVTVTLDTAFIKATSNLGWGRNRAFIDGMKIHQQYQTYVKSKQWSK
eukprot:426278-Amphidinium_carterae.1